MAQFFDHPIYKTKLEDWERYRDLNQGEHKTLISNKYLWPHEFEANVPKGGNLLRRVREDRARYLNYFKSIITRYVSLLFKNDPDLSEATEQFAEDMLDVDGEGTTLLNFIKNKLAPAYFLYGRIAVLTDAPSGQARNKAEEKEIGLRPYWTILEPFLMRDWAVQYAPGKGKQYKFIRTEYEQLKERTSPTEEPRSIQYSDVYTLENGVYRIERYQAGEAKSDSPQSVSKDWQLLKVVDVANDFWELPIAVIAEESWMHDLAERAMLLYNLESALDNQLNYQAFQRLIATGQFNPQDAIVLNEASVTLIQDGSAVQVVEPSNPIALKERIGSVASTMFQIAFSKSRVLPNDSRAIESADSQAEGKDEFINCMKNASSTLEQCVKKMLYDFAIFKGIKEYSAEIDFAFDVTIEDVDQEKDWMLAFWQDIKQYPTWHKEALKRVVARTNVAEKEAINIEIETIQPAAEPQPEEGEGILRGLLV